MTPYDPVILQAELRRDEGCRTSPYRDTTGHLTIGVGRNLDAVGVAPGEIALMLANDIARAAAVLDANALWWRGLDPVRQRVVLNMAFNIGWHGLSGFSNTLAAMRRGDFAAAAVGMRASVWAGQVGARADRLIHMMATGAVQP